MRYMKRVALLSLFIVFLSVVGLATSIQAREYYSGKVFTGKFIRVGINDYGVFGVWDEGLGATGFQYPIGGEYESLAVGWWGDGWSVFYGNVRAGFSPHDGAWGTIEGVMPKVSTTPTRDGYIHTIVMNTSDRQLQIAFKFRFYNDKKFVSVVMFVKNIGGSVVSDLEVKKIVDWDVWMPYIGDFSNYWGMDNVRRPRLNLAVAFINSSIIPGVPSVYMGFASLEKPTNYDLNWDSYKYRGIYDPVKTSLTSDGKASVWEDYCVVYQWVLGQLKPGETKVIHMVYAAGDNLRELEYNAAAGLRFAKTMK